MDVLDFVDLEGVGLADSRKEGFFGDPSKQPEQDIGGLDRVFALGLGVLQKELNLRAQSGHQLKDALQLGAGRAQKEAFPMAGELRLVVFFKDLGVTGHAFTLDEDLAVQPGVGRRDRVAVGVELREGGLTDGACETPIGPRVKLGQRPKLLFG